MYDLKRPPECSIARAMEILGERWTFLILPKALYGVLGCSYMNPNLGIARNILSTRLQNLCSAGIFERQLYQEEPERYEYRLTQAGRYLFFFFLSLNHRDLHSFPTRRSSD